VAFVASIAIEMQSLRADEKILIPISINVAKCELPKDDIGK
jgi:hypothetical protein